MDPSSQDSQTTSTETSQDLDNLPNKSHFEIKVEFSFPGFSYTTATILSGTQSLLITHNQLFPALMTSHMVVATPFSLEYAKILMRLNPNLAQKGFWHTLKHVFTKEGAKGKHFSLMTILHKINRLP